MFDAFEKMANFLEKLYKEHDLILVYRHEKQEVQEATLMPYIVYSYVRFIRLLLFMIKFHSGRSSC